jgi:hypothetical protein
VERVTLETGAIDAVGTTGHWQARLFHIIL